MDPYQYLLLMAACLVITVPLELVLGARVWRRPRRLLLTLLPVVVLYTVWDTIKTARGTWDFSEMFTTGVLLPGGLPVEEVVFFVVVPTCGLLTYEAVGRVRDLGWRGALARPGRTDPGSAPSGEEAA